MRPPPRVLSLRSCEVADHAIAAGTGGRSNRRWIELSIHLSMQSDTNYHTTVREHVALRQALEQYRQVSRGGRACPSSGAEESVDSFGQLSNLAGLISRFDGLRYAMLRVVVQQQEAHLLEAGSCRIDLGQDVDAVAVL